MKKSLLIAALLISTSAFATGNNNDTINNYDQRNYGGNTSNAGGNGGQGGAGGIGYGGSASASAGAVAGAAAINQNDIKNTNTNQQGQQQGQSQSVKNSGNSSSTSGVKNSGNSASLSSSNSGGNTQSNAGNNTSVSVGGDNFEAARIPVAMAYSSLAAPSAPCMGSSSGGIQGMSIGISVGSTWTSEKCDKREDIRTAYLYGDKEVAEEMVSAEIEGYAAAKKRLADRKAAVAEK